MQVKTIEREKLVNRLVDVFASNQLTKEYESASDMRMGVCGWNGVMSPLTRCTYIQDFGASAVAEAEAEARKILADRAEWFANTQYANHTKVADTLAAYGIGYRPAKGDYVWCVNSGLKGDGGVPGEIRSQVEDYAGGEGNKQPRLVLLQDVCEITDSEIMDADKAAQLVQSLNLEGGTRSDDVEITDICDWYKLNDDQKKTFYTYGVAVVTPSGKWYVIDSEGYDYARYIYLPVLWRDVFKSEVDEVETRQRLETEAVQKRAADEKAKRLASYLASCKKWEPLMINVSSLIEAAKKHQYGTPQAKAAKRAINNACRKNILTMVQTAFPGVKFRLVRHDSLGCDWELSWVDGPTMTEFRAATNLRLFCTRVDTFDGMTDCAGVELMEFTSFAEKYMYSGGDVEIHREMSAGLKAEMQALVAEIKPQCVSDECQRFYWTDDELQTLGNHYGVVINYDTMAQHDVYSCHHSLYSITRLLFDFVSLYKPQDAPRDTATDNKPTEGSKVVKSHENGENETAPHSSLSLKDMDGGVYVDGSSRATYCNRREIKAHGATWNKQSQRWEATEPDSIAQLRAWFDLAV